MTVTYETVKDLFLFLDPLSEFSGLLFSELLLEWGRLPAVGALLSPDATVGERCMSFQTDI